MNETTGVPANPICRPSDGWHMGYNVLGKFTCQCGQYREGVVSVVEPEQSELTALRRERDEAQRGLAVFTDQMDDTAGRMGVFGKGYVTSGEWRRRAEEAEALLPNLLDELEPAWREAYDDPQNYVRSLYAALTAAAASERKS